MAAFWICTLLLVLTNLVTATQATSDHPMKHHMHHEDNQRTHLEDRIGGSGKPYIEDPSYQDILDYTEKHITDNRLFKRRMSLDDLKVRVQRGKTALHAETCAQRAVKSCDLRAMALLQMVDGSPCTLIQEYMQCMERETRFCRSTETALLMTSLRQLVGGLQQQGHCASLSSKQQVALAHEHVKPARPCSRKGTWMCMTSLVEDLKVGDVPACASLANFRHCLHMRTTTCHPDSVDLLIRASRGLARIYRRLTHQC